MKNTLLQKTTIAIVLIVWTGVVGIIAQAPQLRTSNTQIRATIDRIKTKAATLQRDVERGRFYSTATNADERVTDNLTALIASADSLRRTTYSRGADTTTDVGDIVDRARRIDRILSRNDANARISSQWTSVRGDINQLAGYYGVSPDWGGGTGSYPGNSGGGPRGGFNTGLTGTYRLNAAQSDDVTSAIDRAVGSYGTDQRDNMRRTLERRLASPDMIAIDKNGRSITMASSNQREVSFDADGIARTETNRRGRTITTKVTSVGNNLTIDYTGDRVDDFNVTFGVDRSGRLKVTRRIYLENRNDTVSVSSVYDRTSTTADFSSVGSPGGSNSGAAGGNTSGGDFYIPNGTSLTATLINSINTKASQVGDRFTMEVTSPDRYRGAVIEGHVGQAASSGRVTGRANVSLEFDNITMNGRRYDFAGLIQSVTAANGDSVSVNNEGTVRDSSQTNKTATRAGIGAILGAVIGGIAGGGSGAAIGAGVGAGAGAGTVLLGGRDGIELGTGSTFIISASAPAGGGYTR